MVAPPWRAGNLLYGEFGLILLLIPDLFSNGVENHIYNEFATHARFSEWRQVYFIFVTLNMFPIIGLEVSIY